MDSKINILVSGVGSPGGPGILKALRKDKRFYLIGIDASEKASGANLVDKFYKVSRGSEPSFITEISEICQRNNVNYFIPLVTSELEKLSANKDSFKKLKTDIICSDAAAMNLVNDKALLHQFFECKRNLIPNFKIAESASEISTCLQDLGYPEKEVVMRKATGNGSRGFRIITDKRDRFNLLFNEKPSNLFLDKSELDEIVGSKSIPKLIFTEFLPGVEITVDTLISKGEVKSLYIRTRDKIISGISVAGEFIIDRDVEEKVKLIASSVEGLYGPIGLQFKQDAVGNYKLLEMNPRLQGASVTSLGIGVNLPVDAIRLAMNELDFKGQEQKEKIGFMRYWDEIFYDIR